MLLNTDTDSDALEAALSELKTAGIKATRQRAAIVHALVGDTSHPTAQELYARLLPTCPGLSFATVYNTLGTLARAGRIRPIAMSGPTRFDPVVIDHHHAICDGCGAVQDVPSVRSPRLPTLPEFEVSRVEQIFRGLCAACRADAAQTPPKGGNDG
ncbi:MAG: transcriptional repressor [Myxococcales bacterium]|nr:transcriptional repressor [Myxococcales bacterium]